MKKIVIGYDAKRIVRNATGLGSYSRTLVNDLAKAGADSLDLRLYAPDEGRDELRQQVETRSNVHFCYPYSPLTTHHSPLTSLYTKYWRSQAIVDDLERDGVHLFHGLSGELPSGLRRAGIPSVVTIHDLIFLRHPEYYHWLDAKLYAWKFRQTIREADHIIAISECTKRDIMHFGHVPEEKISIIYQSFAPRFTTHHSPLTLHPTSSP